MRVIAVDPHADEQQAQLMGVCLTNTDTLLQAADVISNHMNQTAENECFFDEDCFRGMQRHPIFLNVSRGASVDEQALVRALDEGWIRAAGLDVLREEKPDLAQCPLLGRENVIVTPHAAFYSARSIEALQRLSCRKLHRLPDRQAAARIPDCQQSGDPPFLGSNPFFVAGGRCLLQWQRNGYRLSRSRRKSSNEPSINKTAPPLDSICTGEEKCRTGSIRK